MATEKLTVIDFHAHILPELDHGCESVQMSMEQLILAAKAGTDVVVATSHFYPHLDTVNSFLRAREEAYTKLQKVSLKEQHWPEVWLGAEVLACVGMERMEGLEHLCIQGTRVLLLEMPFTKTWEKPLLESVRNIVKGLQVVIAHADRYSFKQVQQLIEAGCLVQLNADAICKWSKRNVCRRYLQTGKVVALGSDIHGTGKGYRYFQKAQKILGDSVVEIMYKTKEICREVEYT